MSKPRIAAGEVANPPLIRTPPHVPLVLGICPRCRGPAFVRLRDLARFCPDDGLFYEVSAREVLSPAWVE